jgi:hypothetical protein
MGWITEFGATPDPARSPVLSPRATISSTRSGSGGKLNGVRFKPSKRAGSEAIVELQGRADCKPRTYVGLSGFGIEIAAIEPLDG